MRKFYMMFAAIITLAAISFVSCGSDDKDDPIKYETYTLTTEVELGSLTGEPANMLLGLETSQQGEYASDAEAIEKYDQIVSQGSEMIEYIMQAAYLASGGIKDFKVHVRLYNAKGKQIKNRTYSF
ncbi:MAG: hypothetical protein MJY59_05890 [Bacteroidaceae bacterium]|nr:hypothetical protein [Bacteroidaceae bacterium]